MTEAEAMKIRNAIWEAGLVGEVGAERGPVMLKIFELISEAKEDGVQEGLQLGEQMREAEHRAHHKLLEQKDEQIEKLEALVEYPDDA